MSATESSMHLPSSPWLGSHGIHDGLDVIDERSTPGPWW